MGAGAFGGLPGHRGLLSSAPPSTSVISISISFSTIQAGAKGLLPPDPLSANTPSFSSPKACRSSQEELFWQLRFANADSGNQARGYRGGSQQGVTELLLLLSLSSFSNQSLCLSAVFGFLLIFMKKHQGKKTKKQTKKSGLSSLLER